MKPTIIIVSIITIAGLGAFAWYHYGLNDTEIPVAQTTDTDSETTGESETDTTDTEDETTDTETVTAPVEGSAVIGQSAGGQDITAFHFGTGDTELLFIGGVHGGYSWSTPLVAYELIDYLEANPNRIPENLRLTVIPVLNPDGLQTTLGTTGRFNRSTVPTDRAARVAGRFNANDVDLNRNFGCQWQAQGTWQTQAVSGGSAAFSEPESQAVRDYIARNPIAGAVVWYSAAGGVYASTCSDSVSSATQSLTQLYATASGYTAHQSYDYYEITGDMVNWMAGQNIPAISVLLTEHDNTEWNKNRAGIEAMLTEFSR